MQLIHTCEIIFLHCFGGILYVHIFNKHPISTNHVLEIVF